MSQRRFEPIESQDIEIVSVNFADAGHIVLGVRENPATSYQATYMTLTDTNARRLAGDIIDLLNGVRKTHVA